MAAGRATSEWYPPKERAFLNGLVNAGSAIGAVIATPLVAWITVKYGWRFSFVATGAIGLVWVVLWLALYRLPEKHPLLTAEELDVIRSEPDPAEAGPRTSWAALWLRPDVWGLLLARFFSDPVWWFYLFWMPKYLVEQRGFTMAQIGVFAWLPYLTSDAGAIAGGWISGRLIARSGAILPARYQTMLPAVLFMPASIAIPFINSPALALTLICAITFFHQVWKTNLMTITNDIYPVRSIGSVSGIVSLGSGLGGVVFMNIVGHIVGAFSYTGVFIIMGFLHPLAYLLCRLLVPPNRRGEIPIDTVVVSQREGSPVTLP